MTMTATENYIRSKAIAKAHENLDAPLISKIFSVDYRNVCAYLAGRKVMPLDLAFRILEYCNCRTVVFQNS